MKAKFILFILFFLGHLSTTLAQNIEVFVTSNLPINGIAISKEGRAFVSMPQWIEGKKSYGVAEIVNNKVMPYPNNQWNIFDINNAKNSFSNVNAVHIDDANKLWVVDYAAPYFGNTIDNAQKVIKINLDTNEVERVYYFNEAILPAGAKLNDIRVDSKKGIAYISEFGIGAIIVLDIQSGESRRVLNKHYSTRAHPGVTASFNGKEFKPNKLQVNDIELSSDKENLFYQPTGGPILYKIKTSVLTNKESTKKQLEDAVEVFSKSTTIGGLTIDGKDNLYLGSVSDNSIIKVDKKGRHKILVQSNELLWPDAMAIYKKQLYIPCPQLMLLPKFNNGKKVNNVFKVLKFNL
ncbi:L-dopachrome tautomerase-related protein [Maribacter ulvicola]|uniref:Major royal jelly protein n=1 Tax=Maribacter ulvicola TaxID=228959 RepID=A0A1N6QTA8_9FLAO|nr:L-dopachrome tautomerase-related protein [Maribacter ulvicola]SIQ19778.1 Major royal jelly protein [Maribacter ulvicola]